MKNIAGLIAILSFTLIGCKNQYHINCENFKNGVVADNSTVVGSEIDQLCTDLHPNFSSSDKEGQQDNIYTLSNRISIDCGIITSVICYNCIKTGWPQSEIRIEVMDDTVPVVKFLNIYCTDKHELKFAGMHN